MGYVLDGWIDKRMDLILNESFTKNSCLDNKN